MLTLLRNFTLIFSVLAIAGCVGSRTYGEAPDIVSTELAELPVPAATPLFAFAPLSSVEITVRQDETLSGTYFIDENGILEFPLIGPVEAANTTPSELSGTIAAKLDGPYVIDPDVSARPLEIDPSKLGSISLGGAIGSPGQYPVSAARTLLRAINLAGGLSDTAERDKVLIIREIDDTRYLAFFSLAELQNGNAVDPNLYPNDIVMVGENRLLLTLTRAQPFLSLLGTVFVLTRAVR